MSSITTHHPCHYSLDFDPAAALRSLVERLKPTLATTSSTLRFPQYDMTRYEYFLQAQVPVPLFPSTTRTIASYKTVPQSILKYEVAETNGGTDTPCIKCYIGFCTRGAL